jgi:hypothetical protein
MPIPRESTQNPARAAVSEHPQLRSGGIGKSKPELPPRCKHDLIFNWNFVRQADMSVRRRKMDKVEKFITHVFNYLGHIAGSLDSTTWAILAACTLAAGIALLKGPGIRGA